MNYMVLFQEDDAINSSDEDCIKLHEALYEKSKTLVYNDFSPCSLILRIKAN